MTETLCKIHLPKSIPTNAEHDKKPPILYEWYRVERHSTRCRQGKTKSRPPAIKGRREKLPGLLRNSIIWADEGN